MTRYIPTASDGWPGLKGRPIDFKGVGEVIEGWRDIRDFGI